MCIKPGFILFEVPDEIDCGGATALSTTYKLNNILLSNKGKVKPEDRDRFCMQTKLIYNSSLQVEQAAYRVTYSSFELCGKDIFRSTKIARSTY